ncbi:flagellar biosynthesis protein FlgN [uncultured Tateyamaria sp.]|uniref:flagellar biosynthesis protein FlgN n=1 Tax=Tateyamaria sp. 1078 TaxID=3417464 RepID=UPI002628CF67|nr:flagellar biosynthesis protein FlgN [uncultured Tateyamaria sp.]
MKDDTPYTILASMDALLEEERAALLSGDLDSLGDMHSRKEALLDQLGRLDVAEADTGLQGVQAKLQRNQALLDSALAGIRSVARRLAMVRRVRQSLEYYDEDGAKASVDIGVERSVEKRA